MHQWGVEHSGPTEFDIHIIEFADGDYSSVGKLRGMLTGEGVSRRSFKVML